MTQRSTNAAVLVVEDEPLLRMLAVDLVEDAGFRVLEACDADEAVRILETRSDIGIVFTDIDMPGSTNGLALAKIARKLHPSAAIMVVSGRRTPGAGDLPDDAKFVDKPYDNDAVMKTFGTMLPKD